MNSRTEKRTAPEREKIRGLLVDLAAYTVSFLAGSIPFMRIADPVMATASFTLTATVLIFLVSTYASDVSVYDPYWSVAPPVMLLMNILKYRLWNVNALVLLALTLIWAWRLTANWYAAYRGIGHEDWRYARYRKRCGPLLFHLISFFGLHLVPTLVVFGGMVSAFLAIRETRFAPLTLPGAAVMLGAVLLEHVSDRAIHRFLRDQASRGRTCRVSVWKYSRHPNYLGEMLFWTGLYLYFAALLPGIWYAGLGFLSIILLFLTVSIPMMERHNLERRSDYADYQAATPVLIPRPLRRTR